MLLTCKIPLSFIGVGGWGGTKHSENKRQKDVDMYKSVNGHKTYISSENAVKNH